MITFYWLRQPENWSPDVHRAYGRSLFQKIKEAQLLPSSVCVGHRPVSAAATNTERTNTQLRPCRPRWWKSRHAHGLITSLNLKKNEIDLRMNGVQTLLSKDKPKQPPTNLEEVRHKQWGHSNDVRRERKIGVYRHPLRWYMSVSLRSLYAVTFR